MEHIKEALGNLRREVAIPSQKMYKPEPVELTLEEKREELRQSLNVTSLGNTFDALRPWVGTEKALAAFKALASEKTKWKMLLCYGGVGNGKTHLCEATAIALYKRGIFCRVLTMSKIMQSLKRQMRDDAMITFDELLERFCRIPRLIIDDVGMGGSGSEWEWGQLEDIVVARYRERLFTIITTNLDITEVPERIKSRFEDREVSRLVLNEGANYRRIKGGASSKRKANSH